MGFTRLILSLLLTVFAWHPGWADPGAPATSVHIRVLDTPLNTVSDRLFGQFLERASFGEAGPEAALVPGTTRIQPAALSLLQAMDIPVIRFPGGSDVDYLDWRDMIDHVPGREGERPISFGHRGDPISNQFGIDEYFRLRDTLGNETILVVNLLDAVSRRRALPDAARLAAGLIAYTNAPVGAELPDGMPDWPAIRAENGHRDPFRVEYVQLGNESWVWPEKRLVDENAQRMDAASMKRWMRECLIAFIDEIRAVDPDIQIIVDGRMPLGVESAVLADPAIRAGVDYVAFHRYEPGPMRNPRWNGEPVPWDDLQPEDWWRAWTAMPGHFDDTGRNLIVSSQIEFAVDLGYRIAVTEWNWNGWKTGDTHLPAPLGRLDWEMAAQLGVAGFLHGLMRSDVELATQSMLIGSNWQIAAVKIDQTGQSRPYYSPQARVTNFYKEHHGNQRLQIETSRLPTYEQPLSMGWSSSPHGTVALVDLLATRSEDLLYVHIVNRNSDRSYPISIDLSAFPAARSVMHHVLVPSGSDTPLNGIVQEKQNSKSIPVTGLRLNVRAPARSVSVVTIDVSG